MSTSKLHTLQFGRIFVLQNYDPTYRLPSCMILNPVELPTDLTYFNSSCHTSHHWSQDRIFSLTQPHYCETTKAVTKCTQHWSEGYPYTFQFSKQSDQSTHWHTTGWCYVPRYLFVNGKNLAGPGDEATSCTHPSTRQNVKINNIRDDSNRTSFQATVC